MQQLHADFEVVAKVGRNFMYLREVAAAPIITQGKTTEFVNEYRDRTRTQRMIARCGNILPTDIKNEYSAAVACGVIGEVKHETIIKMRKVSKLVLADVQGMIRMAGKDKGVFHVPLHETGFRASTKYLDVLKVSAEEARYVDIEAVAKDCAVIVTQGMKGCTIYDGQQKTRIGTAPLREVDATGAGDSFLAGLAYGLVHGLELKRAAKLGNLLGGIAVGHLAIPRLSAEQVRRARAMAAGGDIHERP
ncbi:MAG: hypothetical protein HY519_02120, partial [Candidatus Aenigmarchaeota archaeon]|nr:hypothetical protein [Candidatus Aenigmarchaeota archaeon]